MTGLPRPGAGDVVKGGERAKGLSKVTQQFRQEDRGRPPLGRRSQKRDGSPGKEGGNERIKDGKRRRETEQGKPRGTPVVSSLTE